MLKRFSVVLAVLVLGMMILSACAPAAAPVVEEAEHLPQLPKLQQRMKQ